MKAPAATGRMKISLWTMLRQIRAWNVHGVLRTLEQKHAVRAGATLVIILTSWSLFLLSVAGILDLQLLVQHEFFLMIRYGYVAALWLLIVGTVMVLVVEWRGIMSLLRIDQIDLGSLEQRHPYLPTKPFVILSFVLTLSAPVLFYAVTQQTSAAFAVVEEPYVYAEARSWQIANDMISNGANAIDVIGQYVDETASPLVPAYTKGGVNNSPHALGLNQPYEITIDGMNHRLFLSDSVNKRVLVFNLDASNALVDFMPDYVLCQPNFSSNYVSLNQAGCSSTAGLAIDTMNNRLFVSDYGNNRVLVFNTSSITNGMNATNVLGQNNFTVNTFPSQQAGMQLPRSLAVDSVNNRLFVADSGTQRVLIFNVSAITNGMNAKNVLGQTGFGSADPAITQKGMYTPYGLAYDATNNRLFVTEVTNNRVTVFNTSTITNGMNAVNVLGQSNFTSGAAGGMQAGMTTPSSLAIDTVNNRLFVADGSNNRIMIFDVNTITNGMNAVNVLGQSNFTGSNAVTTQTGISAPQGLAYISNSLFVAERNNHRISVFDVSSISNGMNASKVIGQYADATANPLVPVYTTGAADYPINNLGVSSPYAVVIDETGHRIFIADYGNNRVLVYNLDVNNIHIDDIPDNVLGQSTFIANISARTQEGMSNPKDLAYDSVNNRLFVADSDNRRVIVFSTVAITNGMNATNVLGQSTFTDGSSATTQAGMSSPQGLAYDGTNSRLFVADYGNNRVTIFRTTSIINGMNATNVLGQSIFTASSFATTQNGMYYPRGLAYDATNSRLFIADSYNRRVIVHSVASITDGQNAANVLGQPNFTRLTATVTQNGMNVLYGLAYEAVNNHLFVADSLNNRVIIFNTSSMTNGMNASLVLGQGSFTASAAAATQAAMNIPSGLAYDNTNRRLYVTDNGNNRIIIFDVGIERPSLTLSGSPNPSVYGSNATLTATLTSPEANGIVTFMEGAGALGSVMANRGSGSLVISTALHVGAHSLTAVYAGSGGYLPSTSDAYVQTVTKGTSSLALTGPTPAPAGMVSLSAIVTPASATGTVTFSEGEVVVGSGMVIGGIASAGISNISMGSHTFTATYGGNADVDGSTSGSFAVTVTKGNSSTTLVTSPDPSGLRQPDHPHCDSDTQYR